MRLLHKQALKNKFKASVSKIFKDVILICGPGSSVGIATGYGLDDPGIES